MSHTSKYVETCRSLGIILDPRVDEITTLDLFNALEARLAAGSQKTEIGRRIYGSKATPAEVEAVRRKNKNLEERYRALAVAIRGARTGFADLRGNYPGEPQ